MSNASERRVVLVTGASTGFGRLTAEALARRGHIVFAGLRDLAGRNARAAADLSGFTGGDLRVVELDVTDDRAPERAVAAVLDSAGHLDVVVNNAGVVYAGPVEAFTAAEAARQFDVNVGGALRVNRAVIPHLRDRGRGALIQVSSISDRVTVPFTGLYSASKAALAALTEAWRHELAPAGIESVSVAPASYATDLGRNGVMAADAARTEPYLPALGAFMTAVSSGEPDHDRDPQPVADALVALVEAPDGTRPHRTVIGSPAQREAVLAVDRSAAATARAVTSAMGIADYVVI